MKNKKVYIGIIAIILICVVIIASIFYIKANNKDVKISKILSNFTNENTKEAMNETEKIIEKVDTNKKEVVKISVEEENTNFEGLQEVKSPEVETSDEKIKNENSETKELLQNVQENNNSKQTINNQVPESKKEMKGEDFLRGRPSLVGKNIYN